MKKLFVADHIANEISHRIFSGIYAQGESIPTVQALASEFSTSCSTISKTLRHLQQKGLLDVAPRRGTRVVPLSERPASATVGIWIPSGAPHKPEPVSILRGMQDALRQHGHHFEVALDLQDHKRLTADMFTQRFAGVLFIETFGIDRIIPELDKRRFPYVVANMEKQMECTCTWVDHRRTTQTAVRVLTALGHRRIALLTRPSDMFFYEQALAGYKEGIREVGVPFDDAPVIVSESPDSLGAYLRMREFLERHEAPTGIVAARDYLAGGAYQALTEKGLQVGRDVSLVGFDDLTWAEGKAFLTTFAEPSVELGGVAAEMLVERLISGWRPPEKREIAAPLILRRSVGPCPGASAGEADTQLALVARVASSRSTS